MSRRPPCKDMSYFDANLSFNRKSYSIRGIFHGRCVRVVHRRDQFGTSSIPIFPISNVTGTRLNLLRSCLNLLPVRNEYDKLKKLPAEFRVSGSFEVEDVGTIVAGTVCSGSIQRDDRLLLGPDSMTGRFEFVRVRSIHNKRVPVDSVSAGQSATMAISSYDENTPITRRMLRKGVVLVNRN